MAKPYNKKDTTTTGCGKRVTVREQLRMLIKESHYIIIADVLDRLNKEAEEDICLGLIAAIKWHIYRPYISVFMQTVFDSCIWLINDGDRIKSN